MNLFELAAKITLDTNDYEKGVNAASKKNDNLFSSFKKTAQGSETLKNKIAVLSSQYEESQSEVKKLTEEFNKSAKESGVMSNKTQELAEKLKEAEKKSSDLKNELDGLENQSGETGNKIGLLADKIGSGLKTAAKIGTAAISTAAAGIAKLTSEAVKNYAEYEQLVGGVETLFKSSADVVMNYAANAYKTAGMSANEYMETVTSFSASLLQSLDNDTAAAAKKADLAITDMSDKHTVRLKRIELYQRCAA